MARFNLKSFERYLTAQHRKRAWKQSLRAAPPAATRADAPVLALAPAARLAA